MYKYIIILIVTIIILSFLDFYYKHIKELEIQYYDFYDEKERKVKLSLDFIKELLYERFELTTFEKNLIEHNVFYLKDFELLGLLFSIQTFKGLLTKAELETVKKIQKEKTEKKMQHQQSLKELLLVYITVYENRIGGKNGLE